MSRRISDRMIPFVLVMTLILSLMGCSTGNKILNSSTDVTPVPKPMEIKTTIYFVNEKNGNKKYLKGDEPIVLAVSEIIKAHCDVTDNRSFERLDFSSEYALYTDEFLSEAKKSKEKTVNFYKGNEIETRHSGIMWFEISFNATKNESTVRIINQFNYIKAKENFLSSNNFTDKDIISQQRIYYLVLRGGQWKINKIDSSGEVNLNRANRMKGK